MNGKMIENYGILNLSIRNFLWKEQHNESKIFGLNNNIIVFNKPIDATEVEIQIHDNIDMSKCVPIINEYLKWLNGDDCKNKIIKKFIEFVNGYSNKTITKEEIIQNNWYEELTVQSVIISIPCNIEKIDFCIICVDKWHVLYIEMDENKIISMNDEYVDPENGLGYNGIWTKI